MSEPGKVEGVNVHREVHKDTGNVTIDFSKGGVGAQYTKEQVRKIGKGNLKAGINTIKNAFQSSERLPDETRPFQKVINKNES